MGRGPRQPNQAIRLAALPRRMSKPQHLGQRRYSVYRFDHNTAKTHRDPGHIRATIEQTRSRSRNYIYVGEEIAAADGQGNLHWVPSNLHVDERSFVNWLDVHQLRRQVDQLNKEPLGPRVLKEVDAEGMLNIGISDYQLSTNGEKIIRKDSEVEKFDVAGPGGAERAKNYYDQVSDTVTQQIEREVAGAINDFKRRFPEEAGQLFADARAAEKSETAKRFAEALSKGEVDSFIAENERAKKDQQARDEAKAEAGRSQRARRAQETLRSLAGS